MSVIVLSVTLCTVGYVCLFCMHQIFVDFVSFLSMIIYGSFIYIFMMFKEYYLAIIMAITLKNHK